MSIKIQIVEIIIKEKIKYVFLSIKQKVCIKEFIYEGNLKFLVNQRTARNLFLPPYSS
jgi:hypothetical protein